MSMPHQSLGRLLSLPGWGDNQTLGTWGRRAEFIPRGAEIELEIMDANYSTEKHARSPKSSLSQKRTVSKVETQPEGHKRPLLHFHRLLKHLPFPCSLLTSARDWQRRQFVRKDPHCICFRVPVEFLWADSVDPIFIHGNLKMPHKTVCLHYQLTITCMWMWQREGTQGAA